MTTRQILSMTQSSTDHSVRVHPRSFQSLSPLVMLSVHLRNFASPLLTRRRRHFSCFGSFPLIFCSSSFPQSFHFLSGARLEATDLDAIDAAFPLKISLPASEKRFHVRRNDEDDDDDDDDDDTTVIVLNDDLRDTPFR